MSAAGYPIHVLLSSRCTVPCQAYEQGVGAFITCGTDEFHWQYHEAEIFSKLESKEKEELHHPDHPKEYIDEKGRVRRFKATPAAVETRPTERVQEFSFNCPTAGKHVYQIIVDAGKCYVGAASFGPLFTKSRSFTYSFLSYAAIAVAACAVGYFLQRFK